MTFSDNASHSAYIQSYSAGYSVFGSLTAGMGVQLSPAGTAVLTCTPGGNCAFGAKTNPGSKLGAAGLAVYANNAAAIAGGLSAGDFYRTGADPDPVMVVH